MPYIVVGHTSLPKPRKKLLAYLSSSGRAAPQCTYKNRVDFSTPMIPSDYTNCAHWRSVFSLSEEAPFIWLQVLHMDRKLFKQTAVGTTRMQGRKTTTLLFPLPPIEMYSLGPHANQLLFMDVFLNCYSEAQMRPIIAAGSVKTLCTVRRVNLINHVD